MSKRKKQPTIQILNPGPDGSTYTNLRRALRHIDNGTAVWAGAGAIRFIERGRNFLARERQIRRSKLPPEIVDLFYECIDWRGTRKHTDDRRRGRWHLPPGVAKS